MGQCSNTPGKGFVHRVAELLGDNEIKCPHCGCKFACTDELATRVIVTADALRNEGDEIGIARKNPETGEYAVRIDDEKRGPLWKVMQRNGETYTDMRPSLPWPLADDDEGKK